MCHFTDIMCLVLTQLVEQKSERSESNELIKCYKHYTAHDTVDTNRDYGYSHAIMCKYQSDINTCSQ